MVNVNFIAPAPATATALALARAVETYGCATQPLLILPHRVKYSLSEGDTVATGTVTLRLGRSGFLKYGFTLVLAEFGWCGAVEFHSLTLDPDERETTMATQLNERILANLSHATLATLSSIKSHLTPEQQALVTLEEQLRLHEPDMLIRTFHALIEGACGEPLMPKRSIWKEFDTEESISHVWARIDEALFPANTVTLIFHYTADRKPWYYINGDRLYATHSPIQPSADDFYIVPDDEKFRVLSDFTQTLYREQSGLNEKIERAYKLVEDLGGRSRFNYSYTRYPKGRELVTDPEPQWVASIYTEYAYMHVPHGDERQEKDYKGLAQTDLPRRSREYNAWAHDALRLVTPLGVYVFSKAEWKHWLIYRQEAVGEFVELSTNEEFDEAAKVLRSWFAYTTLMRTLNP